VSPEEFTQRFAELRAPITAFLYRRVDPNDVDDLAADAFDVAWRRGASVTLGEELPWLYRVAGNLVANHRRKHARSQRFVASLFAPDSSPSAESIAVADIALAEAWGRLPVTSREILSLTALDGLSVTEAAVALDITPNAVSVRLTRARTQLRAALIETS
jgi:RNA polymerase sigma-70 factor (ECF subfamily)